MCVCVSQNIVYPQNCIFSASNTIINHWIEGVPQLEETDPCVYINIIIHVYIHTFMYHITIYIYIQISMFYLHLISHQMNVDSISHLEQEHENHIKPAVK